MVIDSTERPAVASGGIKSSYVAGLTQTKADARTWMCRVGRITAELSDLRPIFRPTERDCMLSACKTLVHYPFAGQTGS